MLIQLSEDDKYFKDTVKGQLWDFYVAKLLSVKSDQTKAKLNAAEQLRCSALIASNIKAK